MIWDDTLLLLFYSSRIAYESKIFITIFFFFLASNFCKNEGENKVVRTLSSWINCAPCAINSYQHPSPSSISILRRDNQVGKPKIDLHVAQSPRRSIPMRWKNIRVPGYLNKQYERNEFNGTKLKKRKWQRWCGMRSTWLFNQGFVEYISLP